MNDNYFILDLVSLNAVSRLSEAAFELSSAPIQTLTALYSLLLSQYKHNRERDGIDTLYAIYKLLGIDDFADAMLPLLECEEPSSNFLYAYLSDLRELIEECSSIENA